MMVMDSDGDAEERRQGGENKGLEQGENYSCSSCCFGGYMSNESGLVLGLHGDRSFECTKTRILLIFELEMSWELKMAVFRC